MLLAEKYAQADINSLRNQDRRDERNSVIYELVRDGDLSAEKGARKLGLTVEQLRMQMARQGYTASVSCYDR